MQRKHGQAQARRGAVRLGQGHGADAQAEASWSSQGAMAVSACGVRVQRHADDRDGRSGVVTETWESQHLCAFFSANDKNSKNCCIKSKSRAEPNAGSHQNEHGIAKKIESAACRYLSLFKQVLISAASACVP